MFRATLLYKVTVHILGSQKGLQGCHIKCYLYIIELKVAKPFKASQLLSLLYSYIGNTLYDNPVSLFGIPKCAQLPCTHMWF